jgi:hypothetical protein
MERESDLGNNPGPKTNAIYASLMTSGLYDLVDVENEKGDFLVCLKFRRVVHQHWRRFQRVKRIVSRTEKFNQSCFLMCPCQGCHAKCSTVEIKVTEGHACKRIA